MMRRLALLAACSAIAAIAPLSLAGPAAAAPTRAYELVSPPDKNGGDPVVASARVRIADDGSAVGFYSQSLFGDVIGAGLASEYVSQRDPSLAGSTQGWSTRGIIPPQPSITPDGIAAGIETRYMGNFSADFTKGVVMSWRPLTDAPAVANVANLYLRDDLRSPGAGHYTLLSDCPACISPFGEEKLNLGFVPQFIASTSDFSHVLFESPLNLTANAKGTEEKLYEWAEGELRLASILPDGKGAAASAVGPRSISNDGSRVFFTAQGNTYMRLDETTTIKLNRSEATTPGTPQGAGFVDASTDGTRIFLTTSEPLTDDAPVDSNNKLYLYDTTTPDTDPHNLTFINYAVRGAVAASADGHTVYFMHSGQLVAGLPPVFDGAMFAWHDGTVNYVAETPLEDQGELGDARVSPSGNLVYLSTEPVGPEGYVHGKCPSSTVTKACRELYVYDITSDHLSCASCDYSATPEEKKEQGNTETKLAANLGAVAGIYRTNREITADGDQVFFTTRASLVPEDTNGALDAYEYEVPTEQVRLISSGTGESSQTGISDSYFLETTPSGDDVIFATRQRLLGWDTDANFDLYDARVGGGFPEPKPAPAPCNGDNCYGPLPPPPVPAPGASASFQGAGDPPVKRKKRKGGHGKKRHHKRASSDRRHRR